MPGIIVSSAVRYSGLLLIAAGLALVSTALYWMVFFVAHVTHARLEVIQQAG